MNIFDVMSLVCSKIRDVAFNKAVFFSNNIPNFLTIMASKASNADTSILINKDRSISIELCYTAYTNDRKTPIYIGISGDINKAIVDTFATMIDTTNESSIPSSSYEMAIGILLPKKFFGEETSLEERNNWKYYESIIEGQNSYNCIWIEGVNPDSLHYTRGIVIDGFTLRNGRGQGAAIRVVQNNPILSNLTIKENDGAPIIYLENSGVDGDRYNEYTLLINNIIANNYIHQNLLGVLSDAIISNIASHVEIMNNTIANNTCENNCYSLIFGFNSNTIITNSILYDNGSDIEYYDNTKNVVSYRNNIIEFSINNTYWNLLGQDLGWNNDDDPMFVDSTNFDYRIQNYSPAYDKGNFDKYDTLIIRSGLKYQNNHLLNYDINCNIRAFDNTIDVGACEFYENTNYISLNYPTLPSEFNQEGASNLNIDNIKIFDMTGSILKHYNSNEEINFSDLQKGIYIIGYFYKNTLVKSNKIVLTK